MSDMLDRFLAEHCGHAPLTPEEEREISDILRCTENTPEAEKARAQAVNRLVRSCYKLVVALCRPYAGIGTPLEDLVQEGNLALVIAAKRYDASKGKFSTYAAWWVKHHIMQAIASYRTIRLTPHAATMLRRIRRTAMSLEEELGREPDPEEVADELGMPLEQCQTFMSLMRGVVSIDAPVASMSGAPGPRDRRVQDIIPDDNAVAPDEHTVDVDNHDGLLRAVQGLKPLQRDVLSRRFGLFGHQRETLECIGNSKGLTRERIRQVELRALAALKSRLSRLQNNALIPSNFR